MAGQAVEPGVVGGMAPGREEELAPVALTPEAAQELQVVAVAVEVLP